MSTRSFIGYQHDVNEIHGNYCHYDGYPEHVGKILVEFHNSFNAMDKIIDGGQIRNFDNDGTIVRFGDGEGELEVFESVKEILSCGYDYAYLFDEMTNSWVCYGRDRGMNYENIIEYNIPGNQPWETA